MNLVSRLFLKGNSPSRTIAFIFEPDMKPTIASATKRSPTPCRIRAAADDANRPDASARVQDAAGPLGPREGRSPSTR
jgi:hypothetical protein